MKSDDFLIQCIVKQFNQRDMGLQQFMIKYSLGEGILAPASVQVTSYTARAAANAARAANPIAIVSMTWANFIANLESMDKLINVTQDTSIYAARGVAFSTSLAQSREDDREMRKREVREVDGLEGTTRRNSKCKSRIQTPRPIPRTTT
jgi:hypothetical protein